MKTFLFLIALVTTQTLLCLGFVNDEAHLYSPAYKEQIEISLREISSQGGPEIGILTLNSLNGSPVEEVARKTFDAWGIGKKEKDNGILLIIAMKEREIRIETGYGVEGDLPDHICGRIIRENLAPKFKIGQFEEGTSSAINALLVQLGIEKPIVKSHNPPIKISENIFIGILFILFILLRLIRRKKPNDTFSRLEPHLDPRSSSHSPWWWRGGGNGGFGGGGFGGGRGGGGGASGRF